MSSDFFKKLQPLFEDKTVSEASLLGAGMSKAAKAADTDQSDREYIAQRQKREAAKKEAAKKEADGKPTNVKESGADFFRKFTDIVEAKGAGTKALTAAEEKELKDNKAKDAKNEPEGNVSKKRFETDAVRAARIAKEKRAEAKKTQSNVKESGADFFRKFADIVNESEEADKKWYVDAPNGDRKAGPFDTENEADDYLMTLQDKNPGEETEGFKLVNESAITESYGDDEEDPDVEKAMKVPGKDGKKQADFEKGKKWSFDKADKKAEDKGAKKAAKDKDLAESYGDDEEDPDVEKAMKVPGKDGKKQADFEKGKKFDFSKLDKKGEDKGAKKAAKDKDLTESVSPSFSKLSLMESKTSRLQAKRKTVVAESKQLITLAESANIGKYRAVYIAEAKKAIKLVQDYNLTESQLNELGGGVWSGIKGLAGAAGNKLKQGAQAVGNAATAAGQAVGNKVQQGAQAVGNAATAAGQAVGNAAQAVGNKVQQGAQAVGNKVQQGAQAVGNAATAAGQAVQQGASAVKGAVSNVAGQVADKATQAGQAVANTYSTSKNAGIAKSALDEIGQIEKFIGQLSSNGGTFANIAGMADGSISLANLKQALTMAVGSKTESTDHGDIEESAPSDANTTGWMDDEELYDALEEIRPGLGLDWADGLDISGYQFDERGKKAMVRDANEWMAENGAPYRFVDCEDLSDNVNWKLDPMMDEQLDGAEVEESVGAGSNVATSDDIAQLFNAEYGNQIEVEYSALVGSSANGDVYFFASYDNDSDEYLVNSITLANENGSFKMVDHGGMPEGEFADLIDATEYIDQHATGPVSESAPERNWIKNSDLDNRKSTIDESKNKYKHIQKDVKDMDKMSPEQLQQYADYLRREANSMKRWIRNEMSDTYANLKKDEYESGHWSVEMTSEFLEELKKAGERGAIIKPSGGAKPSRSIHSDSRGTIGSGSGFTR